ncbi:DgyrCDS13003 [Dimorphilus gyrociliatus]|uniref:DgyrCDS13003 n=1 Tax=Dimorphilus gyrociliatus TaxID=2664684 RepID=A0A7I8W9B5_9ANNE|nr:DgyrCDS13003 [Dimorphilus gyrociliatus]
MTAANVEMTGSNFFDYIHQADQQEVAEQLGLCAPNGVSLPSPRNGDERTSPTPADKATAIVGQTITKRSSERSFCVRMKSTLTKRGVHVKSNGYRVVQILTRLRHQFTFSLPRKASQRPLLGIVGMAIALPPPTVNELPLDSDMFVSRLNQGFQVTYVEPRIADLMDMSVDEMNGVTLYSLCHAEDGQKLRVLREESERERERESV